MPPRRSARVADAAERATSALSPLPLSVVLHIFSLLPVDCRLRCSEVCRGWRSVLLLEPSLWTRLDLSRESGVRVRARAGQRALDGLLLCASARAGGGLQSLRVADGFLTHETLCEVAAANAGALRELHARCDEAYRGFTPVEAEALLHAAPLLRTFTTKLQCDGMDLQAARRALRNEAPFGPLRVRRLHANLDFRVDEADALALAVDVAAHASLTELTLEGAALNAPAALNVVVDAALVRRLQSVSLDTCGLSPASAPALARLLGGDALTSLTCCNMDILDAPAARVLAAALRANSTLTSLSLDSAGVFDDPVAAAELLSALTGHSRLRVLSFACNRVDAADQAAAAGALLGVLIAANAPALTKLDVSLCDLGDDGLRPLFEALPANTNLRKLGCYDALISDAFAADVLLPAVVANESLRQLDAGHTPHARQAVALVRGRR
jgi:hypothetical protein